MKPSQPIQTTSSSIKYQNPWISVREDQVIRPDGRPGIFGVVTMLAGSSVLPLDDQGRVSLVREYKYAIARDSLEVMSGGIDSGETPLVAAQRELAEELQLIATDWTDLGVIDPFTTVVSSPNHMFLARGLSKQLATGDPAEPIEVVTMSLDEAVERVMDGSITHGASCVLILKAARWLSDHA